MPKIIKKINNFLSNSLTFSSGVFWATLASCLTKTSTLETNFFSIVLISFLTVSAFSSVEHWSNVNSASPHSTGGYKVGTNPGFLLGIVKLT